MSEMRSLKDQLLQADRFLEGQPTQTFYDDERAPSLGCIRGDRGFSETASVIFSEDAPPSYADVAPRVGSYTDESNHSELIKFKEASSTALNGELPPDLGQQAVRDMNTNILQQRININPAASYTPPRMKLPCADLLGINTGSCVGLYQALDMGNWRAAEIILHNHPELVRYSITENYETPLHVAVSSAKYTKRGEEIVKQLVGLMKSDDLQLEDRNGETAFYIAVVAGYVQMVKIMVDKNKALLTNLDCHGKLPLSVAALSGRCDMVKYLYDTSQKMTGAFWTHENRDSVLMQCIEAHLFDTALQIVKDRPELATSGNALRILAQQPEAFKGERYITLTEIISSASSALQLLRVMCDHILKLKKNVIDDIIRGPPDHPTSNVQNPKYPSHMLFIAVEKGNTTFVVELIRRYPDLVRMVNDKKQSLFHVAVSYRHKDICSLLYQIGSIKDSVITLEDENGNNMLHLVGQRPKSGYLPDMSSEGMALPVLPLLQQELLWFEEVEAILPPSFRQMRNNDGLTPRQLFMKSHKDLLSKVKRYVFIQVVGNHLIVVATLTVTSAYASALTDTSTYAPSITPPGRWKEDIFQHKTILFKGCLISDTFSLLSSLVSILFLLSIFTSNYVEFGFITTLPTKSLICLGTLFYALVNMMLTFYISLFMIDLYKSIGMVSVFAYVFFAIFTSVYPIFVGMIQVVYHPRPIFYR